MISFHDKLTRLTLCTPGCGSCHSWKAACKMIQCLHVCSTDDRTSLRIMTHRMLSSNWFLKRYSSHRIAKFGDAKNLTKKFIHWISQCIHSLSLAFDSKIDFADKPPLASGEWTRMIDHNITLNPIRKMDPSVGKSQKQNAMRCFGNNIGRNEWWH